MNRDQELCLGVECAWPESNAATRQRATKHIRPLIAAVLVMLGGWQFARGAWIQAKARVAQVLIAQAWQRTLVGQTQAKPWPWADTWPVARLSVPSLGVERYVLEGADGATMAFGPGHLRGTALPGAAGNSVITGHRDTHFAFLRELAPGTTIVIETPHGAHHVYAVRSTRVLDRSDGWVAAQEGPARLTLVTCFPFDALRAGGAERYVVRADAVGEHKDRGGERADRTSHLL